MAKLDIINAEIARRRAASEDLKKGAIDLIAAIEQFNKLDEMYRSDEKTARERLECLYKENKHFTGKWPIVYSFAQTEYHPFFNATDSECNPYFPISKVKDGTFDGLGPLYVAPTHTGAYQRDRNYSGTIEPTVRGAALTALTAFPDTSSETGTGSCSGETPPGSGIDETTCLANGGVWTPPAYLPGSTATEKLRAALQPWMDEIALVQADLCDASENTFWQDILDNLNTVWSAIQVDVVYPNITADFAPGSPEDLARDYLLANQAIFDSHVTNRISYLSGEANKEEQVFFGIVKLRLHQANGSFAKLKASKGQQKTNESIIADNDAAIASLNILKVKNS